MKNDFHILVVPGWYPGLLQPYNGDFIRDQVILLQHQGIHMDVVYADLNIAYLRKSQFGTTSSLNLMENGCLEWIKTGTFLPKNNSIGFNRYIKAFAKWVECWIERHGKPNLVHAQTYLGGIVAHRIQEKYDIPYIITEHYTGWIDQSIPRHHIRPGLESLKCANLVTAVSPFLCRKLSERATVEIQYLPNFIDTDLFTTTKTNGSKALKRIVIIGDLIPRKRVEIGIRTVGRLVELGFDITLTIVGSGGLLKSLQDLAVHLGISEETRFVGQQDKTGVAHYIKNSDLLLHPSQLETFGLVIAEALCCGKPVISCRNGGIEAFEGLPGVFISNSADPNDLAEVTSAILKEALPGAEEIRGAAIEKFSAMAVSKELAKIYNSLLI